MLLAQYNGLRYDVAYHTDSSSVLHIINREPVSVSFDMLNLLVIAGLKEQTLRSYVMNDDIVLNVLESDNGTLVFTISNAQGDVLHKIISSSVRYIVDGVKALNLWTIIRKYVEYEMTHYLYAEYNHPVITFTYDIDREAYFVHDKLNDEMLYITDIKDAALKTMSVMMEWTNA